MKELEKILDRYRRLLKFLAHDIWVLDFTEFSRAKAIFMRYLQVAILTVKGLSTDKIGIYATNLSFFAALSLVPTVALLFAVTGGFGLNRRMEYLIQNTFSGTDGIDQIMNLAYRLVETGQEGIYGLVSFFVFIWTVIWFLQSIEKIFNKIWKVEKSRSIFRRAMYYIGILMLMPFILMLFMWGALILSKSFDNIFPDLTFFNAVKDIFLWLIAGAIIIATFTMMFKYIPNRKVHLSAAFNSAIITGIAFTVIQYLYFETQLLVARINNIYGVFASIPLFLIWMNTNWWIILTGAEISHSFQNVNQYKITKLNLFNKKNENE